MSNIILPGPGGGKWQETTAERSLREKGHRDKQHAVLETGMEFCASETRKDQAGDLLQRIAKCVWGLRQKIADMGWDDDKVLMVLGIQARNGFTRSADGEWLEEGSQEWMDRQALKALKETR